MLMKIICCEEQNLLFVLCLDHPEHGIETILYELYLVHAQAASRVAM
jgi:hypothetical protein